MLCAILTSLGRNLETVFVRAVSLMKVFKWVSFGSQANQIRRGLTNPLPYGTYHFPISFANAKDTLVRWQVQILTVLNHLKDLKLHLSV